MKGTKKTTENRQSWGEIGKIYTGLAELSGVSAVRSMRSDAARAFAAAQALEAIQTQLPDHLNEVACKIVADELAKQGF